MDWRIQRLSQALITIVAVLTLSFVLIRYMPGGPVDFLMMHLAEDHGVDAEVIGAYAQVYTNIHPDDPIHVAYYDYMTSILVGDLGYSIWYNRPVAEILAEALPWTILVMTSALTINFLTGVAMGSIMAYYESSKFDVSMSALATVMTSTPFYIIALLLLTYFSYRLGWFPTGGRYPAGTSPGWDLEFFTGVIRHATLPILSMSIVGWAGISLSMRGNSIQVLGEDYMRVAQLRGLSDRRIALRYVSRNAILPLYTGFMIAIGSAFGGSVILELIFRYPGVGYYLIFGVNSRDYMLMMGGFTLITITVVIALLIADLTYGMLDPRARGGGGGTEAY